MQFRAAVKLGDHQVWVEAETVQELIIGMTAIEELEMAREGESAWLFFRNNNKKGHKFFGWRRKSDRAEVQFGIPQNRALEALDLFAYSKYSDGYKGYQKYEREGEKAGAGAGSDPTDW